MFLPCRPCCGTELCLSGCGTRTSTLRLTISASDYTFSGTVTRGAPPGSSKAFSYFYPGSIWNGTIDLVGSLTNPSVYTYSQSTCTIAGRPQKIEVTVNQSTKPNICTMQLTSYGFLRFSSPVASCASYDDIMYVYHTNNSTFFSQGLQCDNLPGAINVSRGILQFRPSYAATGTCNLYSDDAKTIAECWDVWNSDGITSQHQGVISSFDPPLLFGEYRLSSLSCGLGFVSYPVGSYSETGSASFTITSASFI